MMFGLPPVRLVADFRASAMGIKPKSPGSVATVLKNVKFSLATCLEHQKALCPPMPLKSTVAS